MSDDQVRYPHNYEAVPMRERAAEDARLALADMLPRQQELLAACGRAVVEDDETIRRAGDQVGLCNAWMEEAERRANDVRQPYSEAVDAVDAQAERVLAPMRAAIQRLKERVAQCRKDMRARAAAQATEQRQIEAQLRARAAGTTSPAPVRVEEVKPAEIQLEKVRGDYGSRVFDRKIWKATIVDARVLPDTILKAPDVVAALEKAVLRLHKLQPEIPGATVEQDFATSVRG